MQVGLREALGIGRGRAARRGLVLILALAGVVVLVAGLAGVPHLSGPRWTPQVGNPQHVPNALKTQLPKMAKHARPRATGAVHFPWLVPLVVAGVIVALLLAWWAYRWWLGRATRDKSERGVALAQAVTAQAVVAEPEPDPPAVMSGIELALQTLDEHRDPSDAVVRAWLGLQDSAELSGLARRPAETPSEFTARVVRAVLPDDRAVRILLRLYLRTRFGDHPVTERDVTAVRAALSELVGTWRGLDRAASGTR